MAMLLALGPDIWGNADFIEPIVTRITMPVTASCLRWTPPVEPEELFCRMRFEHDCIQPSASA
jgi:hypothetical protein